MNEWKRLIRTLLKRVLRRGQATTYSQFGEDAFLQHHFQHRTGTYIDVGAYDPILYSNTYALYRRGWHGFAIDPNPEFALSYSVLRPRDTFISAGVGAEEGNLTYFRFSDGAYNTFNREEANERKQKKSLRFLGSTEVAVRPLSDFVKTNDIQSITYLNVDVEGFDLSVLKSHDWSVPPELISVEDVTFSAHAPEESAVAAFLFQKGYWLIAYVGHTLFFERS